jgi:hypothetical protein
MYKQLKTSIRQSVNSLFNLVGFELVSLAERYKDYKNYIPCEQTLVAAKEAGLSVGDYIDAKHNKPGATQDTIDNMEALGAFKNRIDRVCEIGPGSGRYLEKVVRLCKPSYYEIYETAEDWEQWLVREYKVVSNPSDGCSLSSTPSNSLDLVHAHKVLPGQPSLTICYYFGEMARVVREGGKIVFDIVTEDCLDEATLEAWHKSGWGYQHYPCLMPKQYAIDFFSKRGCSFDGSFLVPMKPGKTECMVFTKQSST